MRKQLLQICCFISGLCSLGVAAADLNGITYKNYSPDGITAIHVLNIDLSKNKIIAARAQDLGSDLDSVANIAQHFNAIAAINGGFFRYNDADSKVGLPAGVLKIDNYWCGIAYQPRGAIGWDPQTKQVLVDRLQTKSTLTIGKQAMPICAMNRIATGNKAYLLSSSFRDPINVAPHTAILIADNKIKQILSSGEVTIPSGSYLYHIGNNLPQQSDAFKVGDNVKLQILALPQVNREQAKQWDNLPFIVGGGPLLIINNRMVTDFTIERQRSDFINNKYARTAIGILPNKNWVFVVVDQNILDDKSGMTIPELAQFMKSLGCIAAVNLDGGSSSTMYVNSTLSNPLAFSHPVADAVLVLPRL